MNRLPTAAVLAWMCFTAHHASAQRIDRLDDGPGVDTARPADERHRESVRAGRIADARRAAERGLEWLATRQTEAGYWRGTVGHKQGDGYLLLKSRAFNDARGQGHIGVSALAGIAYLAAGHTPDRGRFGTLMRRTHEYIVQHVEDSGLVTDGGTRMYSHAFGTLFLAEVHGMSPDTRTREALERAVNLIVDCQNELGGWRYNPFSVQADLSVTVCQLQALRAARNIGIRVPSSTIGRAVQYVRNSQVRRPGHRAHGLFYYKIAGPGAYRKPAQFAINAAALTSLYSSGVYERELQAQALRFLDECYPYVALDPNHFFYWYGNYYASQAFFQAGGDEFDRYWRRTSRDLIRFQQPDGRWRNTIGPGDEFSTAVAAIILLIPNQYLPIFQR